MPIAVLADGDLTLATNSVRETVAAIDPSVPPPVIYGLEADMRRTMADERFNMGILGSFGLTALALAMLGVYSVVAHTVTIRSREFGIRMALGATERRIVTDVVQQSAVVIAVGIGIGIAAAVALAGVMESFLFDVQARDPLLLLTVAVFLGGAAALATFLPARRAGRMDPVEAIRTD
jgi:ABC-type antimicrobial peptide transport system permease subunit